MVIGVYRLYISLTIIFSAFLTVSCSVSSDDNSSEEYTSLMGEGTRMEISPRIVWREKEKDYTFTITIGEDGFSSVDSIGIVNGSYIDRWKYGFPSHFWGTEPPWQTKNSKASNYISAKCSRKDVTVNVSVGESGGKKPYENEPGHFVRSLRSNMRYVLVLKTDKDLEKGDKLTVKWNDVKAPAYAMKYFFFPFQYSLLPERDRDLPLRRGEHLHLPTITVKGHTAERLHVTCRPMQKVGEPFSLKIAAIDKHGNLAQDFKGTVSLNSSPDVRLPHNIIFNSDDKGYKTIEGIKVNSKGWYKISANAGSVSGTSNYIVASTEPVKSNLYFGDMHSHTLDCDATNDMTEHFFYGPNVAGLDFGAVSSHAEYFGTKKAWNRYLKETTKANKPGEFITFYGYEWAGEGHANAYFINEEDTKLIYAPRLLKGRSEDDTNFRIKCYTEKEYLQKLADLKKPVFVIAHCHTKFSEGVTDSVLWLNEIYSCHKRDRKEREEQLRTNLQRGLRLGVVAGSDMHRLTIGHLCKDPGIKWPQGGWEKSQYQTAGLQGTYAKELSRKALFEGMKMRNTYGTTGARIVLKFTCKGQQMGSRVDLYKGEIPKFKIEAGGTADIGEIAVCRFDGKSWSEPFKEKPGSDRCTLTWKDKQFKDNGIYYVRITQSDGEQAWSSPVWVSRKN